MKSPRTKQLVLLLSVLGAAMGIGFYLVFKNSPSAAYARLAVDAGVLVAVFMAFSQSGKLAPRQIGQLSGALRKLAAGRTDTRLDAETFDDLSEAAQAFNELAGSMTDRDDPALGAVRVQKRGGTPDGDLANNHSRHPELGTVRPMRPEDSQVHVERRAPQGPKAAGDRPEMAPVGPSAEGSPKRAADSVLEAQSAGGADSGTETGAQSGSGADAENALQNATQNPTVVDTPSLLENASDTPATAAPTADEVRALYDNFVQALDSVNEQAASYEEFEGTIADSAHALLESGEYRAVRFQVTLEGGEVALLPRLYR